MWPIVYDFGLIRIFGFEFHLAIYSYGLMLVVAFYTCYALLFKEMKLRKHYEKPCLKKAREKEENIRRNRSTRVGKLYATQSQT